MAKKIITATIVAEMEVDTNWYDEKTDKAIKEFERKHYKEWFFKNIKSEKISMRIKK